MFMFSQFLVSISVIFCEYCLDLCISMALPEITERLQMSSFSNMVQPKHRDIKTQKERRNCWVRDSPPLTVSFQKEFRRWEKGFLCVLAPEVPMSPRIYLYKRNFVWPQKCDSHPLRSCRSSSKFNLPPHCRRLSEMSSTVFFFSFSLTKALW